jgi:hypothetical protein
LQIDQVRLNKKRNRFTLIEVGALEAIATSADYRPNTTYGTLKWLSDKAAQRR